MKTIFAILFLLCVLLMKTNADEFKIISISEYPYSYNVVSTYSGQTVVTKWENGIAIKWTNVGFSGYDVYVYYSGKTSNDRYLLDTKTVSSRKCLKKTCSTKLLRRDENGLPEGGLALSSGQYKFKVCQINDYGLGMFCNSM